MHTSAKLLKYIEDNNITQAEVSRKTGIKRSRLNLMLHGKRKMPIDDYSTICKALNISGWEFLNVGDKGNIKPAHDEERR